MHTINSVPENSNQKRGKTSRPETWPSSPSFL